MVTDLQETIAFEKTYFFDAKTFTTHDVELLGLDAWIDSVQADVRSDEHRRNLNDIRSLAYSEWLEDPNTAAERVGSCQFQLLR